MGLLDKIIEKLVGEEDSMASFLKALRGCKDDQLVAEEPC